MAISPQKLNRFFMLKLPAAWFCGVRVKDIADDFCSTTVRHKWINQNPFKSMFWAVQGMAAELSTGVLVMREVQKSGKKISMLVVSNKASFVKKATGRIVFTCKNYDGIIKAIDQTLKTGEGQTCWMQSQGKNEDGQIVSTFDFEWTVKVKS